MKNIINKLTKIDSSERRQLETLIKALPEARKEIKRSENLKGRKRFKDALNRLGVISSFYKKYNYDKACSSVFMNEVPHCLYHSLIYGRLPRMLDVNHPKRADMQIGNKYFQLKIWDNVHWDRIEGSYKKYVDCDVLSIIAMRPTDDEDIRPFSFSTTAGQKVEIIPYEYLIKEIADSDFEFFINLLNSASDLSDYKENSNRIYNNQSTENEAEDELDEE